MKQLIFVRALLFVCISFPTSLTAAKVEVEGKAWLDSQKDPAEINVNGTWDSEEWGTFHLTQSEGSREVSGNGGGYEITGVVSGKRLFLLFSESHTVEYCATLSPNGTNTLAGTYSNRKSRLHSGLCQEKSRPMNMKKAVGEKSSGSKTDLRLPPSSVLSRSQNSGLRDSASRLLTALIPERKPIPEIRRSPAPQGRATPCAPPAWRIPVVPCSSQSAGSAT